MVRNIFLTIFGTFQPRTTLHTDVQKHTLTRWNYSLYCWLLHTRQTKQVRVSSLTKTDCENIDSLENRKRAFFHLDLAWWPMRCRVRDWGEETDCRCDVLTAAAESMHTQHETGGADSDAHVHAGDLDSATEWRHGYKRHGHQHQNRRRHPSRQPRDCFSWSCVTVTYFVRARNQANAGSDRPA